MTPLLIVDEAQLRLIGVTDLESTLQRSFWKNALLIPCSTALLSFVLFGVRAFAMKREELRTTSETQRFSLKTPIFVWNCIRLIGCIILLGFCISAAVAEVITTPAGFQAGTAYWASRSTWTEEFWVQISLTCVFLYTSFLALRTIGQYSTYSSHHLAAVLLATWTVYAYRDLWPLATFTLSPVDANDGPLLWARIAILSIVAVIVPLAIPRPYIPIDPEKPQDSPNAEQTSSILSLLLCNFLNPLVFMAYRAPNLPFEKMPPLCDYDKTEHLVNNSFQTLDTHGNKRQVHMLWSLLALFWKEYAKMTVAITIKVGAGFLAPLTINRLLAYVESGGDRAVVKPWVWIILMFSGPVLGSISEQYYDFLSAGCMVRVEGILTQLIFHHSLRIRMVAKPDKADEPGSKASLRPVTPDTQVDEAESSSDAISAVTSATDVTQETVVAAETTTKTSHVVGRINNLITVDTQNILEGRNFLHLAWYAPLQLTICTWFLFVILNWSAIVGIVVLFICFPIQGYVARLVNDTQTKRMKKTDARTENVTEVLNMLRMIKLFAWDEKVLSDMDAKREEELQWVKRLAILQLATGLVNCILSTLSLLATYAIYTAVMKEELTAARIFSSMTVFDLLRNQLHMVSFTLPGIVQAKVSLDRVADFLGESELLDVYGSSASTPSSTSEGGSDIIGFHDCNFVWSLGDKDSSTSFQLRIDGELYFSKGKVTLITGPTSCGKTSLLYALMGEMHLVEGTQRSRFNLPREKGVAFVAQESWVQNDTIKNNVLFGSTLDEARYRNVLFQCGLQKDLELWEAGDETEVGERGLTLSGGQKARLTLARAVYSRAEVLLLDDVLAALDVHTAKWIIDKCLKGDLIRGRTVLMISHNIGLARTVADYILPISIGGIVGSVEPTSRLPYEASATTDELRQGLEPSKDEVPEDDDSKTKPANGKLVIAEEVAQGHVSWAALNLYFSSLGGGIYWIAVVGGDITAHILGAVQPLYLGMWAKEYETKPPSEVAVWRYLTVYSILLVICPLAWFLAFVVLWLGSVRASRRIYQSLSRSILGTTFRWLDTTPQSRVISRFTQDTRALDGPIPAQMGNIIGLTDFMLTRLIAVVIITPVFIITGLLVGVVGGWCSQIYIAAQLPVKRELSNARAPVVAHFGAAIAGIVSLRAYGAQDAVLKESMVRIDKYTRISRTFHNLTRWISIRIDTLSAVFTSSLAAYLVYSQKNPDAGTIGFSINMAVSFSSAIIHLVQGFNDFEVDANSLERLQAYTEIPQEPKPTQDGNPPAYWPSSGSVDFENLSAKYSEDGPEVLHNLSFSIKSGEHIGVVGRTGSGKSTLALSLLRGMITSGSVRFDGIDIANVNLDILRSKITIIPQAPELLAGTLRQNLDPFGEYEELTLNDALRSVGWFSIQDGKTHIGLDSAVASGGGNLSIGQRQLLALARAIVRRSKLLILDEATSAIDHESDTLIQTAIRKELKGVTLIIVAHRLQTIMDADKILVLDTGKLIEYDTPKDLLQNKTGLFLSLVEQSENKDELLGMVG